MFRRQLRVATSGRKIGGVSTPIPVPPHPAPPAFALIPAPRPVAAN